VGRPWRDKTRPIVLITETEETESQASEIEVRLSGLQPERIVPLHASTVDVLVVVLGILDQQALRENAGECV
jgi:hypothetical protein